MTNELWVYLISSLLTAALTFTATWAGLRQKGHSDATTEIFTWAVEVRKQNSELQKVRDALEERNKQLEQQLAGRDAEITRLSRRLAGVENGIQKRGKQRDDEDNDGGS